MNPEPSMAANPPPYSHISFNFRTVGTGVGYFPCTSVALTIIDHRPTAATATVPLKILIPCSRSRFSASLYRAAIKDMAFDLCCSHLHLRSCCVSRLVPRLLAEIDSVNAAHRCYGIHDLELHVFPRSTPTGAGLSMDSVLMESFEDAVPKPTPASLASIEKLVAEKEGDESSSSSNVEDDDKSCMICLDDIITRRSSLKMPCSHLFHETCIVEWLKVSHICPLCRYEMPVDHNDSADNSDHLSMDLD